MRGLPFPFPTPCFPPHHHHLKNQSLYLSGIAVLQFSHFSTQKVEDHQSQRQTIFFRLWTTAARLNQDRGDDMGCYLLLHRLSLLLSNANEPFHLERESQKQKTVSFVVMFWWNQFFGKVLGQWLQRTLACPGQSLGKLHLWTTNVSIPQSIWPLHLENSGSCIPKTELPRVCFWLSQMFFHSTMTARDFFLSATGARWSLCITQWEADAQGCSNLGPGPYKGFGQMFSRKFL